MASVVSVASTTSVGDSGEAAAVCRSKCVNIYVSASYSYIRMHGELLCDAEACSGSAIEERDQSLDRESLIPFR